MTTTIIIGNGIGMAVDSSHFAINRGLENAWEEFKDDEKSILDLRKNAYTIEESDLEKHHLIMAACRYLKNEEGGWLAEDGKKFAGIYQNYIYKVAKHFFNYNKDLPEEFNTFIDRLVRFINIQFSHDTRCHVATLNYDKLLYEALINKDVLKGYHNGGLVDGIHNYNAGFLPENLIRTQTNFGWYLHLHGSPVFRNLNGKIDKCSLNELPDDYEHDGRIHNSIVLGNSRFKEGMINENMLLYYYFQFFISALHESNKLIIIGYSGLDEHVNFLIKDWKSRSPKHIIEIVEWQNPEWTDMNKAAKIRSAFWEGKLYMSPSAGDIPIVWYKNILNYDFEPSEQWGSEIIG
jgi:hypothetical protein